jgi:hypothetical protein
MATKQANGKMPSKHGIEMAWHAVPFRNGEKCAAAACPMRFIEKPKQQCAEIDLNK